MKIPAGLLGQSPSKDSGVSPQTPPKAYHPLETQTEIAYRHFQIGCRDENPCRVLGQSPSKKITLRNP